jgi:hypothetical protein
MPGVIVAAVAQVDPADERDILLRPAIVAEYDELLVVRAAGPYPHVQQAFPARRFDVLTQMPVFLLAELELVQMRSPHQAPDQYAAPCGVAQNLGYGAAVTGQPLVGVATPVGEQQEVTGPQLAHFGHQFGEVGRSMHQRPYLVPGRPGLAASVPIVESRRGIAALPRGEQPCRGLRHRGPYPGWTLRHRASQQE